MYSQLSVFNLIDELSVIAIRREFFSEVDNAEAISETIIEGAN